MNEWKIRGKDISPNKTVDIIKEIFREAGIDTEYTEFDTEMENLFCGHLSVKNVKGGFFASNGKGMSKSLCMASAYAELIERLSNRMFFLKISNDDPLMKEIFDICKYPVYKVRGDYQPECILDLKRRISESAKPNIFRAFASDTVDALFEELGFEALDYGYPMDDYYRVSTKEYIKLPTHLIHYFSLSNGMAAGNTIEEAIVQALSEIYERYSELSFIHGKYTPPHIPDEYLQQFENIYKIIENIRKEESGRFKVYVFDCSMGKSLPVVCGMVIDTKKQTFGVKFGSHPNFGVAIERIFTEAMQGSTLIGFASNNSISLSDESGTRINAWNIIKVSKGVFPRYLFRKNPDYKFVPWKDVSGKTNKEIAKGMTALLTNLGSEAYILDRSYLGFSSVFIYAPGISEPVPVDELWLKEFALVVKGQTIFKDLRNISNQDINTLRKLSGLKRQSILENTLDAITGKPMFPGNDAFNPKRYTVFLYVICLYAFGRTAEAAQVLSSYMPQFKNISSDNASYCRGVEIYLRGLVSGLDKGELSEILHGLLDERIADKILYDLEYREHALERVYDYYCNGKKCDQCENTSCRYPEVRALYKMLYMKEYENKPDPKELAGVFE